MSDFKRRWRAVRNATYDTKLADSAAQWSDEHIFERLGVKVPKSVPKLKPMPRKGTTKRKRLESAAQRRIEKFNKAKLQGLSAERAYRYRYETFERVENIDTTPAPINITGEETGRQSPRQRAQRVKQWSDWAKNIGGTYPDWVLQFVEYVNAIEGVDIHAKYGWAMVYYAYIDDEKLTEVMAKYVVDPFDGDRYVEVIKS